MEKRVEKLISPTININGGNPQSLIDAFLAGMGACVVLDQALAACAPHGRDYQTAPDGDHGRAMEQNRLRRLLVNQIREELEAMALEVQRQHDNRRK